MKPKKNAKKILNLGVERIKVAEKNCLQDLNPAVESYKVADKS